MKPASWVVVSKATGKAVFETFSQKTADAIVGDPVSGATFDVVPIGEYLASLNRRGESPNV